MRNAPYVPHVPPAGPAEQKSEAVERASSIQRLQQQFHSLKVEELMSQHDALTSSLWNACPHIRVKSFCLDPANTRPHFKIVETVLDKNNDPIETEQEVLFDKLPILNKSIKIAIDRANEISQQLSANLESQKTLVDQIPAAQRTQVLLDLKKQYLIKQGISLTRILAEQTNEVTNAKNESKSPRVSALSKFTPAPSRSAQSPSGDSPANTICNCRIL